MSQVPIHPTVSQKREVIHARGLPVFGVMFQLQRDRLKLVCDMRDRGDVVKYNIAGLSMYQVNQPAGVQRVLQENNRNYPRGEFLDQFRRMFGNGLVFSDGEFWLRQRRLMSPAFHARHIAGYAGLMVEEAHHLSQAWHTAAAERRPVDINHDFTNLTMRVVTRALFSTEFDETDYDLGDAVTVLLEGMAYRFDVPFYPPVSVPTPRNRNFMKAIQTLDQQLYGMIQSRRAVPAGERPSDLLTMLIEACDDEGNGMSDRQLRDEVLTMFAAGHETTANTITWAYSLLASHPQVRERLEEELANELRGQDPTEADLAGLSHTRRVIDETLRLYPPAWVLNRQATEEDEILGYRIPAGTVITLTPYAMHRHPDYWDRPLVFDPDRFLPANAAGRPRFAYFPFGGGPHQCIGQGFALMEAVLVMAILSRQFRLHHAPGFTPEMKPSITLRPKAGMWMAVEQRKTT